MSKEKALEMVSEFAARQKVSAFTQISGSPVADQLRFCVDN